MTLHDTVVRNASLCDHIRTYAGALSPERCAALIDKFEASGAAEACRQEDSFSFTQIDVAASWPEENQTLLPLFLSHFNRYQLEVNARFWPPRFSFEHLRMKRYLPNGRDCFPPHVDVMGYPAARRFMTAILYLNDAEGGETVFPNLGLSITPEAGKLLAFPPLWPFPHAGLPTRSGAKYILHTYLGYPD